MNRYFGKSGNVQRHQRHPQYSDKELAPWFDEVKKGYCFKQAAERAGMDWETVDNTLRSDDEVMGYALDLSLVAGAKIRSGDIAVPDRYDGLYDKYRN